MGRVIVTKTKTSKNPYCMQESGHPLYSYEELCCYIKLRMPLWMEEKMRPGLTDQMKLWNVEVEDVDTLSPLQAAKIIFQAGNYYNGEEAADILAVMEKWEKNIDSHGLKAMGDLYLIYGKKKKAYLSYWEAYSLITGDEEDSFKASLYHGLGIACCYFFYWKEAKKWFAMSLDAKDSQESRKGLELAASMENSFLGTEPTLIDQARLRQKQKDFLFEIE